MNKIIGIAAVIALLSISIVPMQSAQATIFDDIANEINRAIDDAKRQMINAVEHSAEKVINNVVKDNKFLIDEQSDIFVAEIETTRQSVEKNVDSLIDATATSTAEHEFVVSMIDSQNAEIAGLKSDIAELKELLDNPGQGRIPERP